MIKKYPLATSTWDEKELNAIAEYHDQLEVLNTYFKD